MKTLAIGLALVLFTGAVSAIAPSPTASLAPHGGTWTPPPPDPKRPGPGGTYHGPGDTTGRSVPTGGGGVQPASPSPAPSPSPAGGFTPGAPASPGVSPASSTPMAGVPAAMTPVTSNSVDLTTWSYWWYFNREGLLDLRRRFNEPGRGPISGAGKVLGKPIPTRPSDKALMNTVFPALFDLAGDDQQDNIRLSSGIALARIATPETDRILETLRGLALERDPTLREGATLALGIQGDPGVIDELATIMIGDKPAKELLGFKPNDRMRAFAAYGLALAAERASNDDVRRVILRPVLTRFLDTSERTDLRVALASALSMMHIEFGDADVSSPPTKGKPTTPRYRRDLIRILWNAYDNERDRVVRGHLPITLARLLKGAPGELRDEGVAQLLAKLKADPRPQELYGLISSLGIIGEAWGRPSDQELRKTLYREAATQRESHARHLALMALAEVVASSGPSLPPESVQAEFEGFLLQRLQDGRRADRPWLAMAAGSFGARLRKPIPGRMGARARGRVAGELVNKLRQIVREAGSPDELSAAVLALGLIEDQAAAPDVEHLLDTSGVKDVRGYAALSLGLMHRTSAYAKLAVLIDDVRYEPVTLENTAMGLALLDRTRGSALLRDRLATAFSGITAAPLASAIGRVSDSTSVLELSKLAREKDQTLSTREFACIALGLISDRDDLSWRSKIADNVNYAAWTPTLFDTAGNGVLNIF